MNVEGPAGDKAVYIYPEGLPTDDGDTGWDLNSDSDDLVFVDTLISQYTEELCIDTNRIFATGHSFGGCMSNSMGCYRGDVLRAIAPVAGCGPFTWNSDCTGQVAALLIHSPLDTSTSYQGAIQNGCNTWLRANHCDENPECGCHFEEGFEEPEDECIQEAQEPYQTEVTMEVTEDDDKPPILRQYQGCDADFPVVFIDHWNGRDPRYHNPPSWSGEIIWEFFDNLTVL